MSSDPVTSTKGGRLLTLKSAPNGRNQVAGSNGNGHSDQNGGYSSMSEDDDLPLVCFRV